MLEFAEASVTSCNSLLRGEISAVETYDMAIEKFRDDPEVGILVRIRSEHAQAVKTLQNLVIEMRGLPETNSGAWGAITKAIQGTANLLGENSAVKSLQQGEELGQKAYYELLENDSIVPDVKEHVRGVLLPLVNKHIERLQSVSERLSDQQD